MHAFIFPQVIHKHGLRERTEDKRACARMYFTFNRTSNKYLKTFSSMTNQQLWQAVLGELELTLSKANFTTWFRNTAISTYENDKVVISVPNTFTQTWLEKKYHQNILKTL